VKFKSQEFNNIQPNLASTPRANDHNIGLVATTPTTPATSTTPATCHTYTPTPIALYWYKLFIDVVLLVEQQQGLYS